MIRRSPRGAVCVVADKDALGPRDIVKFAGNAARSGASMIQYRDKRASVSDMIVTARAMKKAAKNYGAIFIINDRAEVAVAVDADGLHVGQADIGAGLARKIIGRGKLLGVSAGNVRQARSARRGGADYIGVGPVFATPVKISRRAVGIKLLDAVRRLGVPVVAIGGIDCKNAGRLARRGFKNIAVIRSVCNSPDPSAAVKKLKKAVH